MTTARNQDDKKARMLAETFAKLKVSGKQLHSLSILAKSKKYFPQSGVDAALADSEVRNTIDGEGNVLYKKLYPGRESLSEACRMEDEEEAKRVANEP